MNWQSGSAYSAKFVYDYNKVKLRGNKFLIYTLKINLQINCQATDQGTPQRSSNTYVEVTVIRSQGQLAFSLPSYAITISENVNINSNVITTLAQPGVCIFIAINECKCVIF